VSTAKNARWSGLSLKVRRVRYISNVMACVRRHFGPLALNQASLSLDSAIALRAGEFAGRAILEAPSRTPISAREMFLRPGT
jgi:hypothetical protein